jgi:hypothetical protein
MGQGFKLLKGITERMPGRKVEEVMFEEGL